MLKKVKLGFETEGKTIPIENILPSKKLIPTAKCAKYDSIQASIIDVGIIEPPIVHPVNKNGKGAIQYLLLDGHVRLDILKKMGHHEVFCLISTDDEAYTYNHKVNRLPPIQEHFMIVRAIDKGVNEERIAKALNVNVTRIRQQRDLLNGICPEAIELLKKRDISPGALGLLKKVKPIRQIEMAELMNAVWNFSKPYVQALLTATDKSLFIGDGKEEKPRFGLNMIDTDRMEKEMRSLEQDFKQIEDSYGNNMLNLVLVRGYVSKILDNGKVVRFLSNHYNEFFSEFQKIIEAESLET